MKDTDLKRIEAHLKRTFNTGGIIVKARPKQNDSAEVYVGDEFIGVVFEDEDEEGFESLNESKGGRRRRKSRRRRRTQRRRTRRFA